MSDVAVQPNLTWITAARAAALLAPIYVEPESANRMLGVHAGAGLVRSSCKRMTWKKAPNHEPLGGYLDNTTVAAAFWEAWSDTNRKLLTDWGTGTFGAQQFLSGEWWHYHVLGTVFCEEDILALDGVPPKGPTALQLEQQAHAKDNAQAVTLVAQLRAQIAALEQAASAPQSLLPAPDQAHGPKNPASDAALEAWWKLYQAVRQPHERNDDDMATHFDQCLPDKSVSRARLRTLRGNPKPGPKSPAAE